MGRITQAERFLADIQPPLYYTQSVLFIADSSAFTQAQKFSRVIDDEEEEELGEDSVLLESPLDKIEPYQLFRATLLCKWIITVFLTLPPLFLVTNRCYPTF
jgi:hypothetical protein